MQLSRVEIEAHTLSVLWGASLVVRDDQGGLILSAELEKQLERLHEEVQIKKLLLSDLQKTRIAKAKGEKRKLGRPKVECPPVKELLRRLKKGESLAAVAKELGINRQTVKNRIKAG